MPLSNLTNTELLEYTESVTKEIDGTIATFSNYDQYQSLSDDDLRKKMQETIGSSSLQKDEQLNQIIPLLKKLRINALEKIRNSYNRTEWNISAYNALQTDLEALEKIPPITFFESVVANAEAAKAELQTAQNLAMDEHDTTIHKGLNLQVNMLLDGVFTNYLGDVKSFLGQAHQPATIPFSNCIESLKANMGKAAADSMAAESVKAGQLKLLDQEVESAKTELTNKTKEKQAAVDKDTKPFFRKMVRFFTGNRILKPLDVTAFDASILEARQKTQECENNKKAADLRFSEVESNKKNALQSLETSLKVAETLRDKLEKPDTATVDVCADNARKFFAAVTNDTDLVVKFKVEREAAEALATQQNTISTAILGDFTSRINAAQAVTEGRAQGKETKTAKVLSGLETAVEYIPVPIAAQLAQALVAGLIKYNKDKEKKQTKAIAEFSKRPNGNKILEALGEKLSSSFAALPIEKDSLDDFSTALSKKVIGAIAHGSVQIPTDVSVDVAVDTFVAYLQKEKFVLLKKTVEVKPEFARAGATYTVEGFISKQAIEIEDAKGNKVMLIPESRQEKDEIVGNSKYGSRAATPEEQKDFLANGGLKSYAIFIPKADRLEGTLSKTLDEIFKDHPENKDTTLVRMESAAEAAKGLKGDKLSAALKTSLSEFIELGKRSGGVSNTPDETRVNFNIVKNSLIAMIELDAKKTKASPAINATKDITTASESVNPPAVSANDVIVQMDPESYKKEQINAALKGVTLVDSKKDATSEIMTIIDTIAASLKDNKKGKSKDFNDDLKASLRNVIKLGERANFTRKEDPDRKLFNEVKGVVRLMINDKVAEMRKEGKSAQNIAATKSH